MRRAAIRWTSLAALSLAASALGACRSAAPPPLPPTPPPGAAPPSPEAPEAPTEVKPLRPALTPLAWMRGHWEHDDGRREGREHWIAAGGVLWGIAFTVKDGKTVALEILHIDAGPDGAIRLTAIPGGDRAVIFPQSERAASSVTFANPQHDAPKVIRYTGTDDGRLHAEIDPGQGDASITYSYRRAAVARAPALEDADRAFAAAVAARGLDAWVDAFTLDGVKWDEPPARGHGAIRAAMAPLFNSGARLTWEPAVSALSPAGDMGFTIGPYRVLRRAPGADFEERGRGTYLSLWRRHHNGAWKVAWDGGHPE